MLTFKSSSPLRLVNIRTFKSAKGNDLCFVKLADTATYESEEFMLSNSILFSDLSSGKDYFVSLVIEGRYTNAVLVPVK